MVNETNAGGGDEFVDDDEGGVVGGGVESDDYTREEVGEIILGDQISLLFLKLKMLSIYEFMEDNFIYLLRLF